MCMSLGRTEEGVRVPGVGVIVNLVTGKNRPRLLKRH